MSTQLDTYNDVDDLDPTDELPRLDIAAYEAALAENEDDESEEWQGDRGTLVDDATSEFLPALTGIRSRDGRDPLPELTADVDVILRRIGDLDSQLLSVRVLNAELQARCDTLRHDRDDQLKTVIALRADNSRLGELRSLATEMTERLEEKLRSQGAHSAAQIAELQAQRAALEQQVAHSAQQMEALQLEHTHLRAELVAALALASERAEAIARLQTRLEQSEASVAHLAKQLALKLMDYDTMARAMEARNRTIAELRASADSLGSQLTQALTTVNELSAQLAATNGELADSRGRLNDRAVEVADRDGRIAQLCKDIKQANDELLLVTAQRNETLKTLASYEQAQIALKNDLGERVHQIGELRTALDGVKATGVTLQSDLESARSRLAEEENTRRAVEANLAAKQRRNEQITNDLEAANASNRTLTQERDLLLPLREELATASTALKQTNKALSDTQRSLADLHRDFAAQTSKAQTLEEQLASAQESAEELRGDRDVLQQAVLKAQQTVETHREQSLTQANLLQAKHSEWAAVKAQLDAQSETFANMDHELHTRDERIGELQAMLATAEQEQAATAARIAESQHHVQSLQQLVSQKSKRIGSLKSELSVYAAAVSAIRGNLTQVQVAETVQEIPVARPQRILEPVEHDAAAIVLDRKVTTIGRTTENDVCLRSKLISRHHARLLAAPSGVIIEDTGSTNGCFVNGRQIKQQLMRDGDVLSLGGLRFRLHAQSMPEPRSRGNVIVISEVRTPAE